MKLLGVVVALFGMAAAGTATAAPQSVRANCPPLLPPQATPAGQQRVFGQIISLRMIGGRYVLRFRPAWLLSGYPAEQVMLARTGSRDVPNDSVTIDSGRQFSFLVAPSAKIVVLGPGGRPCGVRTTLASLRASLGAHRNHFWIRISAKYPNRVLELDEQYQP
jgi:hypothetical protein